MTWTYDDKIIGTTVKISCCEADTHGDNPGCVCHLIGTTVMVGERFEGDPEKIPTYYVVGTKNLVRRREVEVTEQAAT